MRAEWVLARCRRRGWRPGTWKRDGHWPTCHDPDRRWWWGKQNGSREDRKRTWTQESYVGMNVWPEHVHSTAVPWETDQGLVREERKTLRERGASSRVSQLLAVAWQDAVRTTQPEAPCPPLLWPCLSLCLLCGQCQQIEYLLPLWLVFTLAVFTTTFTVRVLSGPGVQCSYTLCVFHCPTRGIYRMS